MAATIGVDTCTITNWEKGRTEPELRFIPRIIEFMGYAPPLPQPSTLGERIKQYRTLRGISQKVMATQIGIDPGTLSRLEKSGRRCQPSIIKKAGDFSSVVLDQ